MKAISRWADEQIALQASTGKGAADLTNAVLDGIIGAVGSIDWGGVLVGVGSGIASFLANLDWKVYAVGAMVEDPPSAIALIGAALIPPLLAAVGGFALALGAGIVAVVGAPALLV